MSGLIESTRNKMRDPQLLITDQRPKQLVKAPMLYKYLSPSRIKVLREREIRFTPPGSFNDPFDCRPPATFSIRVDHEVQLDLDAAIDFGAVQFKNLSFSTSARVVLRTWPQEEAIPDRPSAFSADQKVNVGATESVSETLELHGGFAARAAEPGIGVLSLSERWDSALMWAHYAESHRGFVLGIDGASDFLQGLDVATLPSSHEPGSDIVAPPVSPVSYIERQVSPIRHREVDRAITYQDCLLKGSDWSYEKEWRAFRHLPNRRFRQAREKAARGFEPSYGGREDQFGHKVVLFDVPSEAIQEVILGVNMAPSDRRNVARMIANDPELAHVQLFAARYSADGFGLGRTRVTAGDFGNVDVDRSLRVEQLRMDILDSIGRMSRDRVNEVRRRLKAGELTCHDSLFERIFLEVTN
jgi:hypothetical protein